MSKAEKRWPTIQKELLAIVEGLRWSKYYIYGKEAIVHTDHRPLMYLMAKKANHPNLARWVIELQEYDRLRIEYIEGSKNTVADALSRIERKIEGKSRKGDRGYDTGAILP